MVAVHVHGMGERGAVGEIEHHGAPARDREHRRPVMAGRGNAGQRPDALLRRDAVAGKSAGHRRAAAAHHHGHAAAIERHVELERVGEIELCRQRIGRQRLGLAERRWRAAARPRRRPARRLPIRRRADRPPGSARASRAQASRRGTDRRGCRAPAAACRWARSRAGRAGRPPPSRARHGLAMRNWKMRELAVLTMRSRSRSLVLTGKPSGSGLLSVTYWPSRPAIMAS